ncbi:hypothetical protein JQ557_22975 [Bradyrhizobium sp. U87765 SZCCT0131]|uniref:hypothetical protein n=1 Tax=unclassified Bradyrhizobium TaxID=2631580 RepID=UPI001BA63BF9|nr:MULTISPECIES: hypothetical protein [unclassified Bradyrhizobium]MBR1220883.1 hypothetical protein [Bradyrhizobium sp. U87765 SZCCT0131]MBR1260297.1 hypothetical protein [Bradyrhizobium sp. U87765 SZCCT0134]MBR1307454.1 hypothetical protein [Bradyrhizobium sp. U87765 SZCCT0110]MBR1321408.1 hypothetical protein [Bradyrhizobium sp. U87765 SZCCT0109]MBR1349721.1 hypothetical protein [Bradyrhizobium sp. U87765 SZCCT0048]
MTRLTIPVLLAAALTGVLLGGCAQQQEDRPQAAAAAPAPDDDAYCQSRGLKPGSDAYVACRRDRDHVTTLQEQQGKRNLRKIQDYMMDNK